MREHRDQSSMTHGLAPQEQTVTVAVVQDEIAPNLESGLILTRRRAMMAADAGAQLIVFPETWLPGYPAWLDVCRDAALWNHDPVKREFARMAHNSIAIPGPAFDELCETARATAATLVVGVVERVEGGPGRGSLYNSLITIGPDGKLLNHHRKLMPTYTERLVWGTGDAAGLQAVDTPVGRVGGLICWEHWMPLARQALHDSGEDLHVAVWPTVIDAHQLASRHYAFEGRCYVLAAGALMRASQLPLGLEPDPKKVPDPAALVMRGGSAIIGPDGNYLAGPVFDEPTILTAKVDLEQCRAEKMTLDVSGHYSRPDIFSLEVERSRRSS